MQWSEPALSIIGYEFPAEKAHKMEKKYHNKILLLVLGKQVFAFVFKFQEKIWAAVLCFHYQSMFYSSIQTYICKFKNSAMNTEKGKKRSKNYLYKFLTLKNDEKMFTKQANHFTIHLM